MSSRAAGFDTLVWAHIYDDTVIHAGKSASASRLAVSTGARGLKRISGSILGEIDLSNLTLTTTP